MKLALLAAATDADARALVDAARAADHDVSWREDASPPEPTAWEALLDPETADAVIVGAAAGDPDVRVRQIQELVKFGRPALAVHPVVPSVISYFEIDMARGESGSVVQHFNPLVEAPAVAELANWVANGHPELGHVEQVAATRYTVDRARQRVEWHFARDVDLLARLAGRLDRLGAHAAMGDPDAAYASLSVQLLGPRQVPVRWAIEPPTGARALLVTLICSGGRVTLEYGADDRPTALLEQGPNGERRTPLSAADPAAAAIGRFFAAVAAGDGAAASTWPAALDAMELTDSIEISLRRGRMIDIHHRELTEQLAFKGVMSAVGCGVLVVIVPLMLVIGWVAGLLGIPLSNYWPHLLLALLGVFLAMQILPKLLGPKPGASNSEPFPGSTQHDASSEDI
jgi:hypothetical protein